jgi:hypothetical protein
MIKTTFTNSALCIAFSLMLLTTPCPAQDYEIEIAPKVINLQCGGNDFSIHTNIPCGAVDGTVCLRLEDSQDCSTAEECCEVCSDHSKCDNRGNFVGKFEVQDVVNGLCLGESEYRLVMSGTIEGEPFSAAQECEMECDDDEGEDVCELDCDSLNVIDNPKSCSNGEDEETNEAERIGARIRKLIQCMQEPDMN